MFLSEAPSRSAVSEILNQSATFKSPSLFPLCLILFCLSLSFSSLSVSFCRPPPCGDASSRLDCAPLISSPRVVFVRHDGLRRHVGSKPQKHAVRLLTVCSVGSCSATQYLNKPGVLNNSNKLNKLFAALKQGSADGRGDGRVTPPCFTLKYQSDGSWFFLMRENTRLHHPSTNRAANWDDCVIQGAAMVADIYHH